MGEKPSFEIRVSLLVAAEPRSDPLRRPAHRGVSRPRPLGLAALPHPAEGGLHPPGR
jgi:hypothetical protein